MGPGWMPPRDRSPAGRARTLDLASQLLASDLTHEAVGPYLHRLLQPLGIDERVTKAALRLTGRARPKPLRPDLEPATAALRGLEPVHRASYLVAAAERLQDGLDTPGVGYTGALRKEAHFLALHRKAIRARDKATAEIDRTVARHGPKLRWKAKMDARTDAECRRLHGRVFDVRNPPAAGLPGTLHGGQCRCVGVPRLADRAGVAVASLSGEET